MSILQKLRYRLGYVWAWRLRHWWMDTQDGERAKLACFFVAVLICMLQFIRMGIAASAPPVPGAVVIAPYWWVYQLIIALVAAAVSYAMRPRTEQPKALDSESPTTEDGQKMRHHFGTCWVDNEFILAWKLMGTEKIKSKGGKK